MIALNINQFNIVFTFLFFATIFPGLSFAQQNTLNDSFPNTIQYLSSAYLKGMQGMTHQTEKDLLRMSTSLSVSIEAMIVHNTKDLHQSTSQLNNGIRTQLLPEMRVLSEKMVLMSNQVTSQFNPAPEY